LWIFPVVTLVKDIMIRGQKSQMGKILEKRFVTFLAQIVHGNTMPPVIYQCVECGMF